MEEGIAPTAVPQPTPPPLSSDPVAAKRKWVLWKWSLLAPATLFAYFVWQFGWALVAGRQLSDDAVLQFHRELESDAYESFLQQSDTALQNSLSHDQQISLFAVIHSKLGAFQRTNCTDSVLITLNGPFIQTTCTSVFEHGAAVESFTWRKKAGSLKLSKYNITSKALWWPATTRLGAKQ